MAKKDGKKPAAAAATLLNCPSCGDGQTTLPGGTKVCVLGAVPGGWNIAAGAQAGDNDDGDGTAEEYHLQSHVGTDRQNGQITWDPTPTPFSTTKQAVLSVMSGRATWDIDGRGQLLVEDMAFSRIVRVVVGARAHTVDGRAEWQSLEFTFTDAGGPSSEPITACLPASDNRSMIKAPKEKRQQPAGAARRLRTGQPAYLEVTPPTDTCVKVDVQGMIKMEAGAIPSGDQLALTIYVYCEHAILVY
jgi:hypothetical protein